MQPVGIQGRRASPVSKSRAARFASTLASSLPSPGSHVYRLKKSLRKKIKHNNSSKLLTYSGVGEWGSQINVVFLQTRGKKRLEKTMMLSPISHRLSQYLITRAKIAEKKFTHRAAAAVSSIASTPSQLTFLSLLPSSWKKDKSTEITSLITHKSCSCSNHWLICKHDHPLLYTTLPTSESFIVSTMADVKIMDITRDTRAHGYASWRKDAPRVILHDTL